MMIPYTLNLLDLAFTLYALSMGCAELNPFMQSVPLMIVYKAVIVGALLWWLSGRPEPIARYGVRICTLVYAALAVWHLYGVWVMSKL